LCVAVTLPFYNDNASEFFTKNSSFDSVGNSTELPLDMRFNDGHLLSVVSYGVLFVVSTTGNFTVFFLLLQRRRGSRSRINTMLLHLAIADLLVG
jgi:gonadotropin-releasing hormone receptor